MTNRIEQLAFNERATAALIEITPAIAKTLPGVMGQIGGKHSLDRQEVCVVFAAAMAGNLAALLSASIGVDEVGCAKLRERLLSQIEEFIKDHSL